MQIDDMKKDIRTESNRKTVLKFIAFMLLAVFMGFIFGIVMDNEIIKACFISAYDVLRQYELHFYLVLNIVMCSLCIGLYVKSKILAEKWDGVDENQIDKIDVYLDIAGSINWFTLIAGVMLWGLSISNIKRWADPKTAWIIHMVLVFFCIGWTFTMRGKIMSFKHKLDCEEKIHVLDLHFERKYFESRDEGQKMIIYRATYDAHKGLRYIYAVLFFIAITCKLFFGTGDFPVVIICVAWFMEMMIYTKSVFKYKYQDKKERGR